MNWSATYEKPGNRLTSTFCPTLILVVSSGTMIYPWALVSIVILSVSPLNGLASKMSGNLDNLT